MKVGYYGHTNTVVTQFTVEGFYNEVAIYSGMKFVESAVRQALESDGSAGFATPQADANSDEFIRHYYEL